MFITRKLLPVVLLGTFWWLAWSASPRVGVTADEPVHLTAGYLYWTTGDFRFQPENGNLPQRIAALPAVLDRANFPAAASTDSLEWRTANVWALSREFLFRSGNDVTRLLDSARAGIALLGVVLLATIYAWSRVLFGHTAALFSLTLAAFSPTLLAHAGLATSDTAAALGFLLSALAWWRLLHRVTIGRIVAAGVAAGILAVSKFSAALFAPMVVLFIAARLWHRAPLTVAWRNRRQRTRGLARAGWLAGASVAAAAIAWTVIWACYDFRYAAASSSNASLGFVQPWDDVLMKTPRMGGSLMADNLPRPDPFELRAGVVQQVVEFFRDHRLLPEAYLYGLAFSDRHARGRLAYFAGEYRERGWPMFFPVAFLLKTTLPVLCVGGFALARLAGSPRRARFVYRLTPLIVMAVVYGGFSVMSHLNIGHRHILPLYPVLYIITGAFALGVAGWQKKWLLGVMLIASGWQAAAAWSVRPHYLTYFNPLAGGPTGGHRFLVDSSLDWGQGLPELKAWLDARAPRANATPLYLSYFGSDEPSRFGLKATRIGDAYFNYAPRPILPTLGPGTYLISATMLHRVYTEVRGDWSVAYEQRYRELAAWLEAHPQPSAERNLQLATFEQLRFGRLCHYLEQRRPDHMIAGFFFVYELTEPELFNALQAPLPGPT